MKALISFGLGPHAELLEIAKPSFREFADLHDYDLRLYDPEPDTYWPAPWLKVACIQDALKSCDEVLWVDSDVVIVDPSQDVPIEDGKWQALAVHHTQDGQVPNTGVWRCNRGLLPALEQMWMMHDHRNHAWWEQGALLTLMGYDSWIRPIVLVEPTELCEHTTLLPTSWNSHPWDESDAPRFMHATMRANRAEVMRQWATT